MAAAAAAAAMKLHGMALSQNVLRVATVLNEKGIDFEIVQVSLLTGAHKHPDFLALNPFGQIPALQDGDEVLYESRAINRYIAEKYRSSGTDLLPVAPSAKMEVWLEVESKHFYPAAQPVVYELLIKPMLGLPPDPAVVDKHSAELAKVLDVYEAHLADNKYLAGEQFTLADANHMCYLFSLCKTAQAGLVESRPRVKAWWDEISARPAWVKTAAAIPFPPGGRLV